MNKTPPVLVVLSGGQDSTTCLALAVATHGAENVHAITFNYGQRHARELTAACEVAQLCGIGMTHEILVVGDQLLKGTSPLTDHSQPLETYESFAQMESVIGDRVEKTFVPMRNALFLTIAANRAAVLGARYIVTGVCQQDNANYPDCRQQFIDAQAWAINAALGTTVETGLSYVGCAFDAQRGIWIHAPLMNMSKAQSVRTLYGMGVSQFALLAFSHTAYDGNYPPVSGDHANMLRAQGFLEAGLPDPLVVRAWMEGLMSLPGTANYFTGDSSADAALLAMEEAITAHKMTLELA